MNAGSTITSRDSHDVRHFAAERQARSGRPRWKNDATSPATRKSERDQAAVRVERVPVLRRQQADERVELHGEEREEQSLPDADQRGEEEDGEVGPHASSPSTRTSRRRATARDLAGFGSRPSTLSGLSTRASSSSWMCIGVLRRGR